MNTNNTNRNPSFRPTQREIDDVTKRSRRDALKGGLAGGLAGALVGSKYKAKLIGAGLGATAGDIIGRRVGRREGAADVIKSRKALLQNNALSQLSADVRALVERHAQRDGVQFETVDGATAAKPVRPGQHPTRIYPRARGPFVPGNGIDDQGEYELTEERQRLAEVYGWGIVSALDDDQLTEANCQRLHDQVLGRQAKAGGPNASTNTDPEFERHFLASKIGDKAVSEMPDTLVHCNFLAAVRRGDLVEFGYSPDATDFAILNRERNTEGQFVDNDLVSSAAIQRAYHPRDRKTGIENGGGALAAGAAGVGALAILRARKGKRARLTGGSTPKKLGFAAKDDGSHPVRDTLAGVGAGALGVAAALALRKRRRLRLPTGVPKLPPRTIDVETETLSRRLPFLTHLAMGKVSTYKIRRANLRGKRPPTGIHPRQLGKAKKHDLAFLIQDDDFPLLPMKQPKLAPGMRQRVKPAKTRAEVLKRLRAMTELSAGSAVAEGFVDAASLGGLAGETPAQRRARQARISQQQQNAANDSDIANDSTAQPRTLDSALDRLANMNFGIGDAVARGAARFAPEVAAIGAGDVIGESVHDRLKAAQDKKRRRLMRQGVIQATPGMGTAPGVQTTMSAVHDTLLEFDHGNERTARAKRNGTTVAAAGAGAVGGALAGAYHDQGKPVRVSDLRPGDQVYRRKGPGGLYQHTGVVDETGERIVHRTPGSSVSRSVRPETFVKGGRGPLRRETHSDDLPRAKAARNASAAAGTRQGKYSLVGENCQTASSRIASKGAPVSRQLRKVIGGAAAGAIGAGSVAAILNRRKDSHGNR